MLKKIGDKLKKATAPVTAVGAYAASYNISDFDDIVFDLIGSYTVELISFVTLIFIVVLYVYVNRKSKGKQASLMP